MNFYNMGCNDVHNFNLLRDLARERGNFSAFCFNSQRICSLDKFQRFSDYVESIEIKSSLIGVTETWFLPHETGMSSGSRKSANPFKLDGYNAVYASRPSPRRSAGIALYVLDGYEFDVVDTKSDEVSLIHGVLRPTGESLCDDLYVTLVYMPSINDADPLLFGRLEAIFDEMPAGKRHLVLGDFNIDPGWDGDLANRYVELLQSYGYAISNSMITRPATQSLIDHMICNFEQASLYTIGNDLSDHNAIIMTFDGPGKASPTETEPRFYTNLRAMRAELTAAFQDLSQFETLGAVEATDLLVKEITESMARCTHPLRSG